MKFKVGDKVKIKYATTFKDYVGQVGTVEKIFYDDLWWIKFDNNKENLAFREDKMEKVYNWIEL